MPDIYSGEWNQSLQEMSNERDDLADKAPAGEWRIAIEVEGDGISPYIPQGEKKHFFLRLSDGKIEEFMEKEEPIPGKGLNYRLICPAHVFESIAAGVMDPVEKGLDGTMVIRGDMRLLIQNAELANVIFEVYTENNQTEWPKGKPPY